MAALEPDQRQRLQAAIDAAVDVAPSREDHTDYVDQRVGVLPRRLVLAAGRRLTSAGALADPADVFYLRRDELRRALLGSGEGMMAVAEETRMEMARWAQCTPPPTVGAPPPTQVTGQEEDPDRFWRTNQPRSLRPRH